MSVYIARTPDGYLCNADTGHAEVVQVTFDPTTISFADLLEVFFAIHDPTTRNRQGNDVGPQYRSAIFYHSPAQAELAAQAVSGFNAEHPGAHAVTEVSPASTFWPAEDYHQGYFDTNPNQPYCMAVVAPKVRKAIEKFSSRLK